MNFQLDLIIARAQYRVRREESWNPAPNYRVELDDFDQFCGKYLDDFDGNVDECKRAHKYLWMVVTHSKPGPHHKAVKECLDDLHVRSIDNAMRIFNSKIASIERGIPYFPGMQKREDIWDVFWMLRKHKYDKAARLATLYRPDMKPDTIEPLIETVMEGVPETDEDRIRDISDKLLTEGWFGYR